MAVKSGLLEDILKFCKLRNQVTELNKRKKNIISKELTVLNIMVKTLWNILYEIIGRKKNACASFIESGGMFLTKPQDITILMSSLSIR